MMLPEGYGIEGLKDVGFRGEIAETASTFEGNARIKAQTIYRLYSKDTLADDSGLEVSALNNGPGIYSARYAGPGCTDRDNINKLISELGDNPNREARFVAVLVLIFKGKEYVFEGHCDGSIARKVSGSAGFGYDPVFIPEGYEVTFADLPPELKNTLSHRGMAVRKLVDFLKQHL